MLVITILVAVVGAAILGTFEYYKDPHKLRACAKFYRGIGKRRLLAFAIIVCYLLLFFASWGFSAKHVTAPIVALVFVLTSLLVHLEYKLGGFAYKHWKALSGIGAVLGFAVTVFTNIAADAEISKLTGHPSVVFPNAQNAIYLFLALIFMMITISLIAFVIYCVHAAKVFITTSRNTQYFNGLYGAVCVVLGRKRAKKSDEFVDASLFVGLFLVTLFLLHTTVDTLDEEWLNQRISNLLIFSSYHQVPEHCENIKAESIDGASIKIAFLKGSAVPVARFNADGRVRFLSAQCVRAEYKAGTSLAELSSVP